MDADIREALRDIREAQRQTNDKLDALNEAHSNERVKVQQALDMGRSAHKRLDAKEGNSATLWIGVILALLSSAFAYFFGGRKP